MNGNASGSCGCKAQRRAHRSPGRSTRISSATCIFDLRSVFIQTLQAKAVLELAQADLQYYDQIIEISTERFKVGAIGQIDLDRIELLRVQYESEIQTAIVNLRTSKIQLLQF